MARRFLVSGIVQGVGYRFFAVRAARARAVRGWVRNLPDGRVEVVAEGDGGDLDALRDELRRGPRGAMIRDIVDTEAPGEGPFPDFDVRF